MNGPTRFVNKRRVTSKSTSIINIEDGNEKGRNLTGCKSVDLDEIFQFSAARQRALERNSRIQHEEPLKEYVPNRVFINHVDSLNGRVIADYLSEQKIDILKPQIFPENPDGGSMEEINFVESSEEGDEGNTVEKELKKEKELSRKNFEIIGTVDFIKNPNYTRPESVNEILDESKKQDFLGKVLTCAFIIYDITNTLSCHPVQIEEATWILNTIVNQLEDVQKHAPKLFKKYTQCRTFILISTLATWAKTRPIDPENPNLPFTERDYRKRKPHPNYKVHCDFEKRILEIGRKFPQNLRTVVIGSGVTYGHEEDILHFLFKMAWLNTPELPVFKPGNNKIPLIHVDALARAVHLVMNDFPTPIRYVIAVEHSPITLKKIVKLISKKMGSGKYVTINKEEAFTYPEIKQLNFDMLTLNLNIVPGYIFHNLLMKNESELTFKENIDVIIDEYKTKRNLKPVKIFLHGPPASGKSFLSQRLANYYQIHHLHVKEVLEQGINNLKNRILELTAKEDQTQKDTKDEVLDDVEEDFAEEEEEDTDENGEGNEDVETLKKLLDDIEDSMARNERNRLDEQLVLRLFKIRMLSNPCQNQGFVIDGYPKTIEDAKTLYGPEEEIGELEENVDDISRLYNKKIMPELVVSLDASDEFLIQRVIRMPQSLVENSHYVEGDMCRRLIEFRAVNTEENTPLIYFDELDIPPLIYNFHSENDDKNLSFIFEDIIRLIGPPRNYAKIQPEDKIREDSENMSGRHLDPVKIKSKQMMQERREKMENWMFLKNEEKEMEEKALAVLAMPLRNYLMKYIFPTLTRGLVEVARVRPSDPVDYLAEFLFKENPEGKMFQPNYDILEEELIDAMRDYETSAVRDHKSEEVKQYSEVSVLPDAVSNVTDVNIECSRLSATSSKRADEGQKEPTLSARDSQQFLDDVSSGFCKCVVPPSSQSSTPSSITPPIPPSVCTCPYPESGSSQSSTQTSDSSRDSCSQNKPSTCRCVH